MVIPCIGFRAAMDTAFRLIESGVRAQPLCLRGRWIVRVKA